MQLQFTEKANTALKLATKCAKQLKQGYIGTEHILVGLIKEGTGIAAKVLEDAARAKTEAEMARREAERMTRDLRSIRRSLEEKDKL